MTTVFRVFSCVLVILLIGVVANASYVRVLHDADFDHATSEGSWLIEFYAPWYV